MTAVIDLHCHILPGVDDGAADFADSAAMARQADADGIATVCATPHIRHDHPVEIDRLEALIESVNQHYSDLGIKARLVAGGEVAETIVGRLTEDELEQVSLGGSGRWLLLEPAPGPLSDSLLQKVIWLRRVGFRTLIAHPERHFHADAPALLARLVEEGALVQITAEDLTGAAEGASNELARRGLVHVLGTDAHSSRIGRPVRLSNALAPLAAIEAVAPYLDWMLRIAPGAIVRGEEVEPPFGWSATA